MPKGIAGYASFDNPPINPHWPFRANGSGVERWNFRFGGWETLTGTRKSNGYYNVNWTAPDASRRFSFLHIVTWVTHKGAIPLGLEVDHIDGDPSHNNIENLRLLTHQQNIMVARERLGNWSAQNSKLKPHQVELLLALPEGWRCLHPLAARWGMSKYYLGNARSQAKLRNDPRYLKGL